MDYQQAAQHLLKLSQHMLTHAQSAQWDEVMVASNNRDSLIQTMATLAQPTDELANNKVVQILKEVLSINQQLESLGKVELNRCVKDLKDIAQSKKGAMAYQST